MEFVNYMKSEGYEVRWRRTSSRDKKGVFYRQEEHVLERRKACVGKKGCERCLQVWAGVATDRCWRSGR